MAHLRNSMTPEEINIALGDMYTTSLPPLTFNQLYKVTIFLVMGILITVLILFIMDHIAQKYRIQNIDIKNNVNSEFNRKKKAKESPFVTSNNPDLHPTIYKLDKAEKGQNISLTLPYRRNGESDTKGHETKITIVVQENNTDNSLTI